MLEIPFGWGIVVYHDGRVVGFERGKEKPDFEGLNYACADSGVLRDMMRRGDLLGDALEALQEATEGEYCHHPAAETASGIAVCLAKDCHLAAADRLLVEDYATARPIEDDSGPACMKCGRILVRKDAWAWHVDGRVVGYYCGPKCRPQRIEEKRRVRTPSRGPDSVSREDVRGAVEKQRTTEVESEPQGSE